MDFKLQAFGPFLHWLTLIILCIMPVLIAYVIYRLGGLPGAIARSRNHPQADAISAGMSNDLEAALRHGATHVRVGTALLGRRGPFMG